MSAPPSRKPFVAAVVPAALRVVLLALLLGTAACQGTAPRLPAGDASTSDTASPLSQARRWQAQAERSGNHAANAWSQCAANAWRAMSDADATTAKAAAIVATRCTDGYLALVLAQPVRWSEGRQVVHGVAVHVSLRGLSPNTGGPWTAVLARDVPMPMLEGHRYQTPGFGTPLAILAPRCADRPACALFPPEGIFRWATAWFEMDTGTAPSLPRLVIADPFVAGPLVAGDHRLALAADTSAFIPNGVRTRKLDRLAIWGLLGGDDVARRAGLYLLQDYDPRKRPIIMIHGLGSSPLIWAKLSNAIWADPALRERFQVWHVVYQTNAPLLVERHRIQEYLDDAWRRLDPEGDDPARRGVVLVGHSLGGVISRLLCVDSGEVLWNASFTVPPAQLPGQDADVQGIKDVFLFGAYPGVSRAVFLATPHRGSPTADAWPGRLARRLIGKRVPEMQALKRISREHPTAIRDSVRASYQSAFLNSISTLQPMQPVRRAGETLMPAPGVRYHVISGVLPGTTPESDGAVPLASSLLPGAASTLVIPSGHDIYRNDDAIAEVLRILHEANGDE